jgi:hypothetical protein
MPQNRSATWLAAADRLHARRAAATAPELDRLVIRARLQREVDAAQSAATANRTGT